VIVLAAVIAAADALLLQAVISAPKFQLLTRCGPQEQTPGRTKSAGRPYAGPGHQAWKCSLDGSQSLPRVPDGMLTGTRMGHQLKWLCRRN
jgi:hypothetical protein